MVRQFAIRLLLVFFLVILIRNAWVCDDAYITFRTVDNLVNGYGLRWNTAERVQSFTNPLWLFLMAGIYSLTREMYYTVIFVSIAVTLATVFLIVKGLARSTRGAILATAILVSSKSFVDYATPGMENPLTNLLLVLFSMVYYRMEGSHHRRLLILSLIAGLATLNRMDMILFYLPALILTVLGMNKIRGLSLVGLGFVPFIGWECFAVLYYGFPLPNTAYAKLNAGPYAGEFLWRGLEYIFNTFLFDPVTVVVVACGLAIPIVSGQWGNLPLVCGMALYLSYLIKIGGDFMGGRMLGTPLVCAAVFASRYEFPSRKLFLPILGMVVLLGIASPYSPILSGAGYGSKNREVFQQARNFTDERAYYYIDTGLLNSWGKPGLPCHPWAEMGRNAKQRKLELLVSTNIGFMGFCAGPGVHILDCVALSDPLMARLEPVKRKRWCTGHLDRYIPHGYIETLLSGKNCLRDKELSEYYDRLADVTRGNLLSASRIREIWAMNTGIYDHLLRSYEDRSRQWNCENTPAGDEEVSILWNQDDCEVLTQFGKQFAWNRIWHEPEVELSVNCNTAFQIIYCIGDEKGSRQDIPYVSGSPGELVTRVLKVPEEMLVRGYDSIILFPQGGSTLYRVGHIKVRRVRTGDPG